MNLHNKEIHKQYNNIVGALEIARSEIQIAIGEHRKTDYDYQEDFDSVQDGLQADVDYINEAIDLVRQWAIRLDSSIHGGNF